MKLVPGLVIYDCEAHCTLYFQDCHHLIRAGVIGLPGISFSFFLSYLILNKSLTTRIANNLIDILLNVLLTFSVILCLTFFLVYNLYSLFKEVIK